MNQQLDRSAESQRTLTIEKLVYGGEGLGRLEGQVTLVPYVLPGELVQISPERVKTGLLRGRLETVLQPAPKRIVARCEYFGDCGGCQYQHADYQLQLESKYAILSETLRRIGRIEYDREISIISGEPWAYRNRIQLHFADGVMGFHRLGTHSIRDITHCEISSPQLNE